MLFYNDQYDLGEQKFPLRPRIYHKHAGGVGGTWIVELTHPPPRTRQKDYTSVHLVVLGGGAVSYERATPVPGWSS